MCKWVMLASEEGPERLCPIPGEPYCCSHDVELHYHTWLELRDAASATRREERARQTGKLLPFRK
jgi:hypothetical protein